MLIYTNCLKLVCKCVCYPGSPRECKSSLVGERFMDVAEKVLKWKFPPIGDLGATVFCRMFVSVRS